MVVYMCTKASEQLQNPITGIGKSWKPRRKRTVSWANYYKITSLTPTYFWVNEWVSEWVIVVHRQFSNLSAISWREVNLQWDDDEVRFVLDQHAELDFIVLAHWNNSPRVNMPPHADTLFWFRVNQSLLFLLNAACLVEKQPIPIYCLWFDPTGLEPTIYRTRGEHANR